MQPHDRARRLRQPLERALEIDLRADEDPRLPRPVVELPGLADLIAPNPHQRLRRRDLANPAPEVPLAAILLDVADDFQKRLLHHVFGVLGTPQHPEMKKRSKPCTGHSRRRSITSCAGCCGAPRTPKTWGGGGFGRSPETPGGM